MTAVAGRLPQGLNTDVRVVMCDGDRIEVARAVEIDHMATISQAGDTVEDLFAIVKGHPHLEEEPLRARGVSHDADKYLQQWSDDEASGRGGDA